MFTFDWVAGLYGGADGNGDGQVTLEEAYRWAHFKTVEQTIGSRGGVQHPSYAFDLSGQGDVVLASTTRSSARIEWLPAETSGSYFVLDGERQLVLTAVLKPGDSTATLRVPPGRYQVRKREAGRELKLVVALGPGDQAQVRDSQMQAVPYVERARKGGEELLLQEHGPRLAVGMRAGLAAGMTAAIEAELDYRLRMGWSFLEPGLVWRSPHNDTLGVTHSEVALALAGGWASQFGRLRAAAGLQAGLLFFFGTVASRSIPAESVLPVGFSGALVVDLGLALTDSWSLTGYLRPGLMVLRAADEVRAKPTLAGGLSVGYVFR